MQVHALAAGISCFACKLPGLTVIDSAHIADACSELQAPLRRKLVPCPLVPAAQRLLKEVSVAMVTAPPTMLEPARLRQLALHPSAAGAAAAGTTTPARWASWCCDQGTEAAAERHQGLPTHCHGWGSLQCQACSPGAAAGAAGAAALLIAVAVTAQVLEIQDLQQQAWHGMWDH